jgi:hypothetical protein
MNSEEWKDQVLEFLPKDALITWDKLWEFPDEKLKTLKPVDRKKFAWELAELGEKYKDEKSEAAIQILLICYMTLRGKLEATNEEFQKIVNTLHECFNAKNAYVRSAARAAMSVLLMSEGKKNDDMKYRQQILNYLTEGFIHKEPSSAEDWLDIRDGLLAISFAINSLTDKEMESFYSDKYPELTKNAEERQDKIEVIRILKNNPIRDFFYLLGLLYERGLK